MFKIIAGPMFAGKTTSLLDEVKKLDSSSYIVFKPSIDNRYDQEAVVTHNGDKIAAYQVNSDDPKLWESIPPAKRKNIKTVFIDELNFFQYATLFPEIKKLLDRGITVIAAGLMYDSQKKPFGATLALKPDTDEFIELLACCDGCGLSANHSYRKVPTADQVLVGASESYGACCEKCWEKLSQD